MKMKKTMSLLLVFCMVLSLLPAAAQAGELQEDESVHEHSWEVTETVEPTCTEPGYTVYTCTDCGETWTEPLDKLPAEQPAGELPDVILPVSVVFVLTPETAGITLWPAAGGEVPEPEAIAAEEDGSFLLLPGKYTYTAAADGYVPAEKKDLTIIGDEQVLTVPVVLETVREEPEEKPEEKPESAAFEAAGEASAGTVTVSAEPGVFPESAMLVVSDPAPARSLMKASAQGETVVASYAYEITVTDADGSPVQPAPGTTATVAFRLAEANDPNLSVRVLHESAGGREQLPAYTSDGAVIAETTGFSKYTVEFYYDQKEYVLQGGSSAALSDILRAIGLAGEVTAVEVSDETLFSASDESGEWVLTAHKGFDTAEWMKITINGISYEITVTDDQEITNWAELHEAVDAGGVPWDREDSLPDEAGSYVLSVDVKIDKTWIVPYDTVNLCLNGHSITYTGSNGSVIEIPDYASLTVFDHADRDGAYSGVITGGRKAESGGGINCEGTLTINGGLISGNTAGAHGGGIYCRGTLTINGGLISGNTAGAHGGGIYCEGALTINGGTISGNTARKNGGGIYLDQDSALNLSGGSIMHNACDSDDDGEGNGGGIHVSEGACLKVSGSIEVSKNTKGVGTNNVNLEEDTVICVGDTLHSASSVGVSVSGTDPAAGSPRVFTQGLKDLGRPDSFVSDNPAYDIRTNAEGEAQLMVLVPHSVRIADGIENGTVSVVPQQACFGDEVTLTCTPDEGYVLKEGSLSVVDGQGQFVSVVNNESFFMPDTDVTVSAEFESIYSSLIKSANVEFDGVIRLQFTFHFPAEVLADTGAYLTFEKAGKTTTKLISEGTASGDDVTFKIPVPAPEYADDITIRVCDGNGGRLTLKSDQGTDYTENGFVYSVKTYAQKMSQSGSTEQMRNLAKALDDYGTAAQINFQYGDYSGLTADSAVTAVTTDDLAPYALTVTGTKPEGVTGAGITAAFDSDNTLRITFKTDGSKPLDDYTFELDDHAVTPTGKGDSAYLQVKNIAAPNLDTGHTFTIRDGTDTYTITASALSYAYTSVKNGSEARQNLGKALYLYNQAANAKFGG